MQDDLTNDRPDASSGECPLAGAACEPAPETADADTPTEAYWMLVEAGKLWSDTCGYFGSPQEMFRFPFLRARHRAIAADWIRCLEMLVRRIILMIALKLELAPRTSRDSAPRPSARKPRGPFQALRPTLTIMPCVRPGHAKLPGTPDPVSQHRMHTLARRLTAINHAIINAHLYARRTALSLAQIAERHRDRQHPIISLNPWSIREEKLTSGQATMYDQIERAQASCMEQLDLWHARLLEPG